MARQLIDKGFTKVYALKGGWRGWAKAQFPTEKKTAQKQTCVSCHTDLTANIVSDWQLSKHSKNEVACSVCHGTKHTSIKDFSKALIPTPDTCARCHETQPAQFKAGKHAKVRYLLSATWGRDHIDAGVWERLVVAVAAGPVMDGDPRTPAAGLHDKVLDEAGVAALLATPMA